MTNVFEKGKNFPAAGNLFYKDELGDYDSKNYEIDLSKITMYPYQSEK